MKLGILSDTHGQVARTRMAAEALLGAGAEHVLHCGDIGSEGVLMALVTAFDPPGIPVHAALGNVDFDPAVRDFPDNTSVQVAEDWELEIAGRRVGVIHGDDGKRLRSWLAHGRFDLVFTGHTHLRADERHGDTRLINPGAVYRAATPGCAVLDLESGSLEWLDLPVS